MLIVVNDAYAEQVLAVVELIPPGRVMSYGDIAEYVGSAGPRQVGQVLAQAGGSVPWWRVIRANGSPPECHSGEALSRLSAEGTPLRLGSQRVDMRRARWEGLEVPAATR